MIRFILKNERDEYATVPIHSETLERLMFNRLPSFEIVGHEYVDDVKGAIEITNDYTKLTGMAGTLEIRTNAEPKFPEKYAPVIVRDNMYDNWIGAVFYKISNGQFEGGETYYDTIAPLAGNEDLIDTTDNPPFWWIVKYGKPHLVYDKPKK